jgi:hypothetical protein
MAIIYIDNILGDDTNTGLTSSSPLKSINAGFQISVDGDELRVAGGSFSQLPGFITNTVRNTTVQTSDDYSALGLTAGDTISIDTQHLDNWPIEYSTWPVATVGTSSLTFTSNYYLPFGSGTYSVWMFKSGSATQSYHYQGTSTSGEYETISTFTASAVKVSGGWNSTFDNQWGWTGAKSGTPAGYSDRKLFSISGYKPNIVFDKFFFSNCLFNAQGGSGFGFDTIKTDFCSENWFVNGGNSSFMGPSSSNPDIPITRIVNGCGNGGVGANVSGGSVAYTTKCNLWQSVSSTSNNQNFVSFGSNIQGAPIFVYDELNYRVVGSVGSNNQTGINSFKSGNFNISLKNRIYQYGSGVYPLFAGKGFKFRDFQFIDADNSGCSIRQWGADINSEFAFIQFKSQIEYNGIVEDLYWIYPETYTAGPAAVIGTTIMSPLIGIKDNEGYKMVSHYGNIIYADSSTYSTGSQSMRMNIPKNPSGFTGKPFYQYLGAFEKPVSSFTVSVTLKTNISALTASSINMVWGGFTSDDTLTLASNVVLNTSWQTFTYSVNPANLVFNRNDGVATKKVFSYSELQDTPLYFNLTYPGNTTFGLTSAVYTWLGDIKIIQ